MRYLSRKEVCVLLGKKPYAKTMQRIRRDALRRIAANPKLAKYHSKARHDAQTSIRFTMVSLRAVFPEHFDRKDALEQELAKQFREFDRRITEIRTLVDTISKQAVGRDNALANAVREIRRELAKRGNHAA